MALPTSIRKRDGRLEFFEPDKFSRSLFAATEALGAPNSFLAHELADGVLHFLASESTQIASTEELTDLTVKVVRELGHPALAKVYDEAAKANAPAALASETETKVEPSPLSRDDLYAQARQGTAVETVNFSLTHVYPRDLVSAHREGLLELADLETPFELSGMVLPGPYSLDAEPVSAMLHNARKSAGSFISLDGLDYLLAAGTDDVEAKVQTFAETFQPSIAAIGLRVILNLNVAEPPPWIGATHAGTLFGGGTNRVERHRVDYVNQLCLDRMKSAQVLWHLSERDFQNGAEERLAKVADAALAGGRVDFVFDRARQPIVLGPGMTRELPALLGMVGMNLGRLAALLGSGPMDRDLYLRKLGSLARFAKSAGHVRQDFLRKNGDARIREAFLLERAVELIAPAGLLAAARHVAGEGADFNDISELARASLESIRSALEKDSSRLTATAVDCLPGTEFGTINSEMDIPLRKQLRHVATWHTAAQGGNATISLKRNALDIVKEVPDLLQFAWRLGVRRLRLVWED